MAILAFDAAPIVRLRYSGYQTGWTPKVHGWILLHTQRPRNLKKQRLRRSDPARGRPIEIAEEVEGSTVQNNVKLAIDLGYHISRCLRRGRYLFQRGRLFGLFVEIAKEIVQSSFNSLIQDIWRRNVIV